MSESFRMTWRGASVSRDTHKNAVRGLKLASEFLLEEANRTVPHEEGTLGRSGGTDIDEGDLVGSVYYDTPYARRQHEELGFRHNAGRRAKWLERTVIEQKERVRRFLASEIGKGFR